MKVPVTRDTWLSSIGAEKAGSNGGANQLKLKGQQEYVIFDVDPKALKGKIITGAVWHFHTADPVVDDRRKCCLVDSAHAAQELHPLLLMYVLDRIASGQSAPQSHFDVFIGT